MGILFLLQFVGNHSLLRLQVFQFGGGGPRDLSVFAELLRLAGGWGKIGICRASETRGRLGGRGAEAEA